MTIPSSGAAIFILVVFVIPGFVTIRFVELTHLAPERNASAFELFLRTLYYSAWIYFIATLVVFAGRIAGNDRLFSTAEGDRLIHGRASLVGYFVVSTSLLLILPFTVATCGRVWDRSRIRQQWLSALDINPNHRIPTAWDAMFDETPSMMVKITLSDESVIGGWYGPDAFAAFKHDGGDLYLSQIWTMTDTGWFESPVENSLGVWIPGESIVRVELYAQDHGRTIEQPAAQRDT